MKLTYLECGKITNTHGVRGMVKVDSYCDTPEILASLKQIYLQDKSGNYTVKKVLKTAVLKGQVLMAIEGVTDIDTALYLKNSLIYAKREDIPCDDAHVFTAELIGLPVIDANTGKVYGKLTEVTPMPSSDMYHIMTDKGEVLFPAVPEFLVSIDIEQGIKIRPIRGFFDEV